MDPLNVTHLVSLAFSQARQRHSELFTSWVNISYKIGGLLPASALFTSVQAVGHLDVVLRCMEDDFQQNSSLEEPPWFGSHYRGILSDLWVGSTYEIFRLLKARKLVTSEAFLALERDLATIRIAIEKHEIASDRKLPEPLQMATAPHYGGEVRQYSYDPRDPMRAHIMGRRISARGSTIWHALDGSTQEARWIERRMLAERVVDMWSHPTDL
jgi:hypothetical protein